MEKNDIKNDFLFVPLFALFQAVHLGAKGIGLKAKGDGDFTIFKSRGEAEGWLEGLIKQIKTEQGIGRRSERNLDPTFEGGLDYFISPCYLVYDKTPMEKRGWDFEKSTAWAKLIESHPEKKDDAEEVERLLKNLKKYEAEHNIKHLCKTCGQPIKDTP